MESAKSRSVEEELGRYRTVTSSNNVRSEEISGERMVQAGAYNGAAPVRNA